MAKLSTKNFELQESVHSPAHNCGAVPPPPTFFCCVGHPPGVLIYGGGRVSASHTPRT